MVVQSPKTDMIPQNALDEAAVCLKVMAHPVRLQIVDILMNGDFAVHQIADQCGVKQHQICEHLRLMQGHGFLTSTRVGHTVHYKIVSPHLPALVYCIRAICGIGSK